MGEEANVSYAYLKAMQRKRKTGAEKEGQIISRSRANLMYKLPMSPTLSSGLLYERGWENRTLLICLWDKEDQKILSKTHYEHHSQINIRNKWHDRWRTCYKEINCPK